MYVGSYATADEPGISLVSYDSDEQAFQIENRYSGLANPSFLTLNRERSRLYAVSEHEKEGEAAAFVIQPETGECSLINKRRTHGGAPCFITLDQDESVTLVANYLGGNVNLFSIESDGALGELLANPRHEGSSVHKGRQEAAHPHSAFIDPSNRYVWVSDLGTDRIEIYRFVASEGSMEPYSTIKTMPGAGPRHIAFHSELSVAYVIHELDTTVAAIRYDVDANLFEPIQTLSTLPSSFHGENTCAEIKISVDDTMLFCSNRGHDSITVFKVDKDSGRLSWKGSYSSGGRTPRNFNITFDGSHLIAANQDSNQLVAFQIKETGDLVPIARLDAIARPVCIQFV